VEILQFLLEHYREVSWSFEIQSRLLFDGNPKLRQWTFEKQQLFTVTENIEKATETFITYCARNLQLNIDLCSSDTHHSESKETPYWMTKTCQCLRFRARITILYPSRYCLQQGITSDYKQRVTHKIKNKWLINELDCLIRLHNTDGNLNVISLLCYQCVPMPLFCVVQDNDSTNLLKYLINKKDNNGRVTMQTLLEMCIQAVEAIKFVHGKGMVHRDITSDSFSCFLQEDGKICVQLSVFRMATLIWEEGEAPRRMKIGNCRYM